MKITEKFAQSIVDELGNIIPYNINFMNEEGQIIASKDKHRIGSFHEGALKVLETKEKVIVQEDTNLIGSRPGINLPVLFNKHVIGVIGITGHEDEVNSLGEVIQKMTEILVKEEYFKQQTELEQRAKNTFVDEWIHGKIENEKLFASRGWMHGINVHLPRIVCVLDLIDINHLIYNNNKQLNVSEELNIQSLRNKIYHALLDFFIYEQQNIIYMSSDSKYVILHTINLTNSVSSQKNVVRSILEQISECIKTQFSLEVSIGVGQYHKDMEGVVKSYNEANRALEISKKQHRILFYEELGIESFIDEISKETKQDFIERVFPMCEDRKEMKRIIETLETFFHANQSLDEASKKLFIHKNTLQYRLIKIKDQTSYDARKFMDAVMLYVAILFYVLKEK